MEDREGLLPDAVHIFLLCGFAFAQPMYDLLSRRTMFFVARRSEPIDVLALVALLSFLIPVALVLIEALAGLISRTLRRVLHHLLIGVLVAIAVLPIAKQIFTSAGPLLAMAGLSGAVAVWLYGRFQPLSSPFALGLLSVTVLWFPSFFVLGSPVARVVFPQRAEATYAEVDASAPVVMILFDEFSTVSLMDENRRIDAVRYPHFATLARDASWYRNATAVSDVTRHAVSSILTGNYPVVTKGKPTLPTASDYPNNLFTLLAAGYELKVFESVTELCPEDLCGDSATRVGFSTRLKSLLTDIYAVYPQVVLPAAWTADMPDVTQTWKGFQETRAKPQADLSKPAFKDLVLQQIQAGRHKTFDRFLKSIDSPAQRKLYFLHTLLPHLPYSYTPSGKHYSMDTGVSGVDAKTTIWLDEKSVVHAHQRYMLQVRYVDTLIGQLLERLKRVDLYDSSLIVVTADHGVSFRFNDGRRLVTDTNYPDILMVPLFIKLPFQKEARVDDRSVETTDILPTIADALGISLPWPVDGLAANDPRVLERRSKLFFTKPNAKEKLTFGSDISSGEIGLGRSLSLFGSGAADEIYKIGPRPDLVGRRVDQLTVISSGRFEIELDCAVCYDRIDPASPFVFTHVTGTVSRRDSTPDVRIAIAVNGKIEAVTESFGKGSHAKFSAVIPEQALRSGSNQVRLFSAGVARGDVVLDEAGQRPAPVYSLSPTSGSGGERLLSPDNGSIPVTHGRALRGHLGSAKEMDHQVFFTGWAADVENAELVEAIVILENGRHVFSGRTNLQRNDLVKLYEEALRWAGFRLSVPAALFADLGGSEVRVFAVSKRGFAVELVYAAGYKWGRQIATELASDG